MPFEKWNSKSNNMSALAIHFHVSLRLFCSRKNTMFFKSFGGIIGLVKEGDLITINAYKQLIELKVDNKELKDRRSKWSKPEPNYKTGVLGKYARLVSSASKGAVTDQP